MKKNYERYSLLNLFMLFLFILLTFLFILFYSFKISIFDSYQGIFIDDNRIELYVSDDEYLLIRDNHSFYLRDKKYSYRIENIQKNVFKRDKSYHSIQLKFNSSGKRKVNDIVTIRILKEKINIINMFKIIWKDDMDGKTK